MTTTNDLPPLWALDEAARRINPAYSWANYSLASPTVHAGRLIIIELAKMIVKHEPPPVDPDVLVVREMLAASAGALEAPGEAADYRAGGADNCPDFQAALAAYKRLHPRGEG